MVLPPPALAVRNLMEQFAHLCTVMSKMHHRREGYPFGSLVDFAPDPMGHAPLVVQIPGWNCLSNARATLFGDVYPLPENEQEWAHNSIWLSITKDLPNSGETFTYFRMHTIRFWHCRVDHVNEYEALQPDKIAADGGEQNLKVDDAAIISVDSKGIDIRVRQGAKFNIQRLAFEESLGVETLEEAKSALQKVIEKGKAHNL
ncbi:hypothetical protein HID58_095982 [Brassica napus]|uniref:Uncharacterized protein n=1 Tax=Brassica napus TaxID=3708 RepID=A0ABQ7X1W1_BRANA|nr:hypothetical protein HID58_095982 [Brassica napus]